jgi:hypothetical protein
VSLIGVVVGDGPSFAFFETGKESQKPASAKDTIYLLSRDERIHGHYDLHRVKVTGVVDAQQRGFWSSKKRGQI